RQHLRPQPPHHQHSTFPRRRLRLPPTSSPSLTIDPIGQDRLAERGLIRSNLPRFPCEPHSVAVPRRQNSVVPLDIFFFVDKAKGVRGGIALFTLKDRFPRLKVNSRHVVIAFNTCFRPWLLYDGD